MSKSKVVMLAGPGESTNIVYNSLSQDFEIACVIIEKPVDQKTFLKRRVKNLGLPKVIGQVLFKIFVSNSLEKESEKRKMQILQELNLDTEVIAEPKIVRVESVNSVESIEILKKISPQVVVVNGTRIISKKVLESVPSTFINMHAGITPLYRGVHGGYWALANQDKANCGVTIHLVDTGIDTGNILYQTIIHPTHADNFSTYPLLQVGIGLPCLKKAIKDALSNELKVQKNPEGHSKLWSHPTLLEYMTIKKKLGVK